MPLIRLSFDQQRYEADFRFSLVRLRENAENVAFYGGEARELDTLPDPLCAGRRELVGNHQAPQEADLVHLWLRSGRDRLPVLVAAPRYFDKVDPARRLDADLFGFPPGAGVALALSSIRTTRSPNTRRWCSGSPGSAQGWTRSRPIGPHRSRSISSAAARASRSSALDLDLPDGRPLRQDISLSASPGKPLLITGPSGVGKSTVLRAIAGLWPFGRGRIRMADGRALFLPQRPYLPLGTWRMRSFIPAPPTSCRATGSSRRCRAVGLPQLVDRLDEEGNWAQRLSIGEQQRLAFARVLLARPEIVFLDEATSALDEAAEMSLYRLLREAPWRPTIVSVGHHGTLQRLHDTVVDLGRRPVSQAAVG